MAATALVYSHHFLEHDTGPHHPERAERLRAIHSRLQKRGLFPLLDHVEPSPIDPAVLQRVHTPEYVRRFRQACQAHERIFDTPDCTISPRSYEVASLAAGGSVAAADAVLSGRVNNAFCAVRPPGHHAERNAAMGFCFFNNVALAAEYARGFPGINRVAIVDWDVHHGNGTQHHFEADPGVFFCSIHQHPATLYPGTGYAEEKGVGAGVGTTLNIPMAPGSGDDEYRAAFEEQILPATAGFGPDLILVSAGFDAHQDDPLANICLSTDTFTWMARQLLRLAAVHCGGRFVSLLEGGYNLEALASCAEGHIESLMSV